MNETPTTFQKIKQDYGRLMTVVALNLPLVCAILFINSAATASDGLSWLYVITVCLGYYGLPLWAVVTLVFFLALPLRRAAIYASMVILGVFVAYLLVDALAYRVVKFHIDLFWIEYLIRDYAGFGLPRVTLFAFAGILLAIALGEFALYRATSRLRIRRAGLVLPLLTLLSFGFSQIVHLVAYEWNNQSITSLTPRFPLYVPVTSHSKAAMYRDLMPWADAQAKGNEDEYQSLHYPLSDLTFEPAVDKRPPNFVILFLESWRYDAMDEEISPNMYALSEKSSVFLNHLSSGNQTTCGVFGFFYGLHATYWKAVKANASEIDNPVLIDALEDRGYAFGIFAKSRFKRHKIKDTIFSGIDVHEDFKGKDNAEQDVDLTNRLIAFIEEQVRNDHPYMTFGFFKSTHAPYECPKDQVVFDGSKTVNMGLTGSDTDPAPHLAQYHNAVHWIDTLVGRVLDRLQDLDQMDNTVIIISTDHGEAFNDTGENYWGHGTSYMQYQTRIPLILYDPHRAPRRVTRRTAHVDVAPTLLGEYLGCRSDVSDYSSGRDLFDDRDEPRPIIIGSYTNHAYVLGDDVYEIFPVYTKKYKLYDSTVEAADPNPALIRSVVRELARFSDR